ncbi:MAG: non-canonical purine NTP pyrophosphatase, partial [Verrucomicrobia bacterium]|nr:non-canonical purine NTP pyrophosphatase [Verrucomicrobiota bacterium]
MPAPTILVATRNRHKTAEICAILGVECRSLADFPQAPPLAEDAATFAGNAAQKAIQLAQWLLTQREAEVETLSPETRNLVLADDSGLEVDAL